MTGSPGARAEEHLGRMLHLGSRVLGEKTEERDVTTALVAVKGLIII